MSKFGAHLHAGATKEERMTLHALKMDMKRQRNAEYGPTGFGLPIRENKRDRSGEEVSATEQAVGA